MKQNELYKYLQGFDHFFPEGIIYKKDASFGDWKNKADFIADIKEKTYIDISSGNRDLIKKSQIVLAEISENKEINANKPSNEQLENLQQEEERRLAKIKQSQADSKAVVEKAIEKQQEIYTKQIQEAKRIEAALKDKEIYYKVEENNVKKTQEINNLEGQTKLDPKSFIEDTAKEFEKKIDTRNLETDEIKLASKQAAITTYEVLSGESPIVEAAVMNKIVSDPEVLRKITPDAESQEILKNTVADLTNEKVAQFELSKQFIDLKKIDGFTKFENVTVEISTIPREGFKEFKIDQQITSPHIENLNQNNFILDNLGSLGETGKGEIQSKVLLNVGKKLDGYVTKLPTNSLLSKVYNSEVVQLGLSSLGLAPAISWAAAPGSFIGRVIVSSGLAPIAGFIQTKTGINLGLNVAAKVGEQIAGKVAASAGTGAVAEAATGGTLAAGITAAFAWTGPLAPVIGVVGAFLIETLGGWLLSKIPWKKILKWSAIIIGGTTFLISLPFVALSTAIMAGLTATAVAAAFGGGVGGLTLAGFGFGIDRLLSLLGGAAYDKLLKPLLITFFSFCVIVVFVLFVINSGAYMVPTQSASGTLGCSTKIAEAGKKISNNLQLGFNRYYNKSPDYPELWNEELFKAMPNPVNQESSIGGTDMFWCNYMATKSFSLGGEEIPFPLPTMVTYFKSKGRWIDGSVATVKSVCAGDALFFNIPAGSNAIAHVGIVYSVSSDGITTVESNAPYKSWFYPVDKSGHFQILGSGQYTIRIAGFGAPASQTSTEEQKP